MEAAEQTSTRGILNDLRPIRSPIGWVPSRRPVLQGVCVVTGVRRAVPQDLPVAVEVESSYYYSISSYFTYSVFVGRGTGHRDGDHGANAATRTREEARNWSKIASTRPERIRWTKIGKVVLPCPIRWYVVTVSGYLKRHNDFVDVRFSGISPTRSFDSRFCSNNELLEWNVDGPRIRYEFILLFVNARYPNVSFLEETNSKGFPYVN